MANIILIIIILSVVAGALSYIIKEKKRGRACIGCPSAGACQKCKCCSGSCDNSNASA